MSWELIYSIQNNNKIKELNNAKTDRNFMMTFFMTILFSITSYDRLSTGNQQKN